MMTRNLSILLLISILISCTREIPTTQLPSAIIGQWQGQSLKQDFHFFADGTIELKDRKYSTYHGSYTITAGNRLTSHFNSPVFSMPVIRTIKIKGNQLTLINKNGQEEIYIRMK